MKKYLITALTACVAFTTANQLISTTMTNNDIKNNENVSIFNSETTKNLEEEIISVKPQNVKFK